MEHSEPHHSVAGGSSLRINPEALARLRSSSAASSLSSSVVNDLACMWVRLRPLPGIFTQPMYIVARSPPRGPTHP